MRTQRSYAETGDAAVESAILGEDETIDLLNVVGMLRRRKWLIMLVTALGTAAAAFLGMKQTPTYTANSSVMIDPRQLQVTTAEQVVSGLPISGATMATQIGLMRSRDFIGSVMSDLNLFDDPEFNPALAAAAAPPSSSLPAFLQPLEQLIAQLPDEWLIATGLASQPQPILESEAPALARERAILRFMSGAVFINDGTSYLIQIQFTSPDPDKAAVIANKLAERFIDDQLKGKLSATDKATGWLEQRLAELKVEVQKSDQDVARYRTENNIVEAGGASLNDQELADLNGQLITARAELADLQARLRLVRDLRGSEVALELVSDVTNSPAILRLREQVTELERQESELRTLYGERHPRMLQLSDEKAKVASAIRGEVERVARTMENDVRVAATRVASIESALGGLKNRNTQDRAASVQLAELERVALANRTLYEQLLQRFNETRDQQGIVQADARVVAMAAPPAVPSSPGPKLFAAAGFTVSLLLGSLLAILLERLDRGLRSAREVETALGLTTLGLVPRAGPAAAQSAPAPVSAREAAVLLRRGDPRRADRAEAVQPAEPAQGDPGHLVPARGRQDDLRRQPRLAGGALAEACAADRSRSAPSERAPRAGLAGLGRAGRVHGGRADAAGGVHHDLETRAALPAGQGAHHDADRPARERPDAPAAAGVPRQLRSDRARLGAGGQRQRHQGRGQPRRSGRVHRPLGQDDRERRARQPAVAARGRASSRPARSWRRSTCASTRNTATATSASTTRAAGATTSTELRAQSRHAYGVTTRK